jgi:hypothetical protein
MFQSLVNDPSYRDGFFAGIITLLVLGGLSSLISYAGARVNKFFGASKGPPSPSAGPSPYSTTKGCMWGAFILFLMSVLGLALLSSLVDR